jgi:hypothetical protein
MKSNFLVTTFLVTTFFITRWKEAFCSGAGIILLCLPISSTFVGAAEITRLYDAVIPITTRDNERERQQAYGVALQEVLLKLTGRQDTLENPEVKRGIGNAQAYVESWTYRTAPVVSAPGVAASVQTGAVPTGGVATDSSEQLLLQVGFFPSEIQNLLNTARIPLWPQNRPETLLWIVVQQELGERMMLGTTMENATALVQQIQTAAEKRGLPLLLPLLDFTDQRALPIESLWNFDQVAIRQASLRYGNESILALRIFQSVSGETISKAQYLFRDQVVELDFVEDSVQPIIEGSVNLMAEQLAGYYAVLLSSTEGRTEVVMTVEGIKGLEDYAELMQYANNMTTVDNVDVVSVDNGAVQLRLFTSGQLRQLIEAIALDKRMIPVVEATRTGAQVAMVYTWRPQL